eukprot:1860954-Rhodomonas_salina.1
MRKPRGGRVEAQLHVTRTRQGERMPQSRGGHERVSACERDQRRPAADVRHINRTSHRMTHQPHKSHINLTSHSVAL